MTLPDVDPARIEEERLANLEVLADLKENGDKPELVRSVDVSFRGDDAALDRLEEDAEELGLRVIEREESDDGIFLFLEREQTTDEASISALTLLCLQIELEFDVEFDGWGCTAETGLIH
jgi:regulator of RNase E activity RraB